MVFILFLITLFLFFRVFFLKNVFLRKRITQNEKDLKINSCHSFRDRTIEKLFIFTQKQQKPKNKTIKKQLKTIKNKNDFKKIL